MLNADADQVARGFAIFDLTHLLSPGAHDAEIRLILSRLVRTMIERSPAQLAEARGAWMRGERQAAQRQLHAARGNIGSLGAMGFSAIALMVETAIRDRRDEQADRLFARLEQELARVRDAAADWLREQPEEPAGAHGGGSALTGDPLPLRRLQRLLMQRDLQANDAYRVLRAHLRGRLDDEAYAGLDAAMAALDFNRALAWIDPLCAADAAAQS
jgi:HPt (histidine-containing phosphotransfer) domain-containing protein